MWDGESYLHSDRDDVYFSDYQELHDYIDEHQLNIPKYNKKNHFFQPNYHDHIIRNDREFGIIERYIVNNPMNWGKDKING